MQQLENPQQLMDGISVFTSRCANFKLFPVFRRESVERQRIICTGDAGEKEKACKKKRSHPLAVQSPGLLLRMLQLQNAQSNKTSKGSAEPK